MESVLKAKPPVRTEHYWSHFLGHSPAVTIMLEVLLMFSSFHFGLQILVQCQTVRNKHSAAGHLVLIRSSTWLISCRGHALAWVQENAS